jgi:aminopeptidase C
MGACCTTRADRTRYIINEDYKIKKELWRTLLNRSQTNSTQIRDSVNEKVINVYPKRNPSLPPQDIQFEYKEKKDEFENSEPIGEKEISYSFNSSYKNENLKSSETNKD